MNKLIAFIVTEWPVVQKWVDGLHIAAVAVAGLTSTTKDDEIVAKVFDIADKVKSYLQPFITAQGN